MRYPRQAKIVILLTCCITSIWFVIKHVNQFSREALSGLDPYDFPNYYFSGKRLFEGRPIYDLLSQEISSKLGWEYGAYMADPPFTVVILSPLAILEYPAAWWTFLAISLCSIFFGLTFLLRDLGLKPLGSITLSLAVMSSQSSLYLFKRNHLESLLFLGLCLCIFLLRHKRYSSASLVLGVLSAIKLFPAFILLTGYRQLGIKNALFGALVMVGLSLLGVLVCDLGDTSFRNTTQYLSEVLARSEDWLGTVGNFSLRSFLVAFGSDPHSISFGYVMLALVIALAAVITGASKKSSLSMWLLTSTIAALLLSPLAWLNYLVLLVPPAVYFFAEHKDLMRDRSLRILVLVGLIIFWPTYIDVDYLPLSKIISLFPTIMMSYLIFEPCIYQLLSSRLTLMSLSLRRASNCPK